MAVNVLSFEFKRKRANPYEALTEVELLVKLEQSRKDAAQGIVRDADDVIADLRARYGL